MERNYRVFKNREEMLKFFSGYNPNINTVESLKGGSLCLVVGDKLTRYKSLSAFLISISEQTGIDISVDSSSQRGDFYIVYFNTPLEHPRKKSVTAKIRS